MFWFYETVRYMNFVRPFASRVSGGLWKIVKYDSSIYVGKKKQTHPLHSILYPLGESEQKILKEKPFDFNQRPEWGHLVKMPFIWDRWVGTCTVCLIGCVCSLHLQCETVQKQATSAVNCSCGTSASEHNANLRHKAKIAACFHWEFCLVFSLKRCHVFTSRA